jgi:large subunit ribosomal protein L32
MAVPKQRKTKSRRNQRRMHIHIKTPSLKKCPKCGQPFLPHAVCPNCGYYKGRQVVDVLKKLNKKEKKAKEKELAEKEATKKGDKKSLDMKNLSQQ